MYICIFLYDLKNFHVHIYSYYEIYCDRFAMKIALRTLTQRIIVVWNCFHAMAVHLHAIMYHEGTPVDFLQFPNVLECSGVTCSDTVLV